MEYAYGFLYFVVIFYCFALHELAPFTNMN